MSPWLYNDDDDDDDDDDRFEIKRSNVKVNSLVKFRHKMHYIMIEQTFIPSSQEVIMLQPGPRPVQMYILS